MKSLLLIPPKNFKTLRQNNISYYIYDTYSVSKLSQRHFLSLRHFNKDLRQFYMFKTLRHFQDTFKTLFLRLNMPFVLKYLYI